MRCPPTSRYRAYRRVNCVPHKWLRGHRIFSQPHRTGGSGPARRVPEVGIAATSVDLEYRAKKKQCETNPPQEKYMLTHQNFLSFRQAKPRRFLLSALAVLATAVSVQAAFAAN